MALDVSVFEDAWEARWRLTVCEVDHNGIVDRWFFMEAGTGWVSIEELLEWIGQTSPEYRVMAVKELT